ncbi:hypothetical protein ACYULU_03420 [Breznakiellaceae bacterium SP9]
MALSSPGLANEIVTSVKGIDAKSMASKMLPEIGHAIARYLTKNTDVMYSWIGIQPGVPPISDPVVAYTTTQILGDITCSPTQTNDPIMHGMKLGKQITDGIKTFQIMPAAGWVLPPGDFLCTPAIVLQPCMKPDIYSYWLFESDIILTFYKAWIKSVPLMGSHGTFLAPPGSGAIMSLIS